MFYYLVVVVIHGLTLDLVDILFNTRWWDLCFVLSFPWREGGNLGSRAPSARRAGEAAHPLGFHPAPGSSRGERAKENATQAL